MRIRLSEADRKRLGCPEWLDVQLTSITAREAATIQRLGGYDPDELAEALKGTPVMRDGQPVYETDADGNTVMEDGKPKPKLRYDFDAWVAVIWLALKRAGVTVPYNELDFDLEIDVEAADPEGEVPAEGKESDSTPTSESTPS
jgi:hypothetical protein